MSEEKVPNPIADEIGSMNQSLEEGTDNAEISKENQENKETEKVEEKQIEAKDEKIDPDPTPESEPEKQKEEPKKEEVSSEKESEPQTVDERNQTIADLRAEVARLSTPKPEVKKEEPPPAPKVEYAEQDFVGETDPDELVRDPKVFNALLNKVYRQAAEDTRKSVSEGVLRSIPDIVKANADQQEQLKTMKNKFYAENKDLEAFPKVVAAVFEETAAAHPDRTYEENLKDVAVESRKRLGLHKTAAAQTIKEKNTPPKLPTKGGKVGRPSSEKPSTDAFEADLNSMNDAIGR